MKREFTISNYYPKFTERETEMLINVYNKIIELSDKKDYDNLVNYINNEVILGANMYYELIYNIRKCNYNNYDIDLAIILYNSRLQINNDCYIDCFGEPLAQSIAYLSYDNSDFSYSLLMADTKINYKSYNNNSDNILQVIFENNKNFTEEQLLNLSKKFITYVNVLHKNDINNDLLESFNHYNIKNEEVFNIVLEFYNIKKREIFKNSLTNEIKKFVKNKNYKNIDEKIKGNELRNILLSYEEKNDKEVNEIFEKYNKYI